MKRKGFLGRIVNGINRGISCTIIGICMFVHSIFNIKKEEGKVRSRDFRKLFYEKESEELLNARYNFKNFWILVGIMVITFLAIGFSNGSLIYLGEKMNDPYVNFVNIVVPAEREKEAITIIDSINYNDALKSKYSIVTCTGFAFYYLDFVDYKTKQRRIFAGRTIDLTNPLLPQIMDSRTNRIVGKKSFDNEEDPGLIVTSSLLESLHYPLDARFIYVSIPDEKSHYAYVPIPITAVVRNLPKDTEAPIDFFSTYYMYRNIGYSIEKVSPFSPDNTHSLIIYYAGSDSTKAVQLLDSVVLTIYHHPDVLHGLTIPYFETIVDFLYPIKYAYTYKPGYTIKLDFSETTSYDSIVQVYDDLISRPALREFKDDLTELFYQPMTSYDKIMAVQQPWDRISVHFSKLDEIEQFIDNIVVGRYGFPRPDMAQIIAKKNFNYITKLTRGISLILLFFSVFSIISYLSHVLESHLDKIKPTIGTFMAFGTPDLGRIFLVLMFIFIAFPLVVSIILAGLLGNVGVVYLVMKAFIPTLEYRSYFYFDLFTFGDSWVMTTIAILLILVLSYLRFRRTITRIFRETPGNLIFGRV